MTRPNVYDPTQGYKYQILYRNKDYDREWSHCDYAIDKSDEEYLMGEYKMALDGYEFKSIKLPKKYWL